MSPGSFHWSSPLFNLSYWWLSGGIPPTSATAIYQPKGAASASASYVNLANPGVFDIVAVNPVWDAVNGWNGGFSRYMRTGVIPTDENFTILLRYASLTTGIMAGQRTASTTRMDITYQSAGVIRHYNNGVYDAVAAASGVTGWAGKSVYVNGAFSGTMGAGTGTGNLELYILATNLSGAANSYTTATVQAVAIYNSVLSAAQVFAVSTAMAAL